MKDKFNNAIGPQVRTPKAGQGKIIPLLAAASFLGGLEAATQFFASTLQYHDTLGPNFHNLYAPWSILSWAGKWYSESPEAFMRAGGLGITVTTVSLLVLAIAKMVQANSSKINPYLHGSARWANKKDIQDAGLLPRPGKMKDVLLGRKIEAQEGVYVGAWLDQKGKLHYLRHNGPEHVLTYAPTRSGKGVGLVIPTLLSWPHSAVITDLKGELWALTAGWRKQHARNKVLRFEPATLRGSVRWNPLDEIRIGTEFEVGDVQNLATLIVDPDGKGLETHWHKTSQALLVGVILHALYKAKNEGTIASLPEVDAILADTNKPIAELWMEMTTYAHVNGHVHPVVGASARDMMDRPEEEAGSVLSTAKSYLALFRDPVVAYNVTRSEFSIKDLMNFDDPVSLYIVTTPNDKPRLRPLVRILINMIVRLSAGKVEFEHTQSGVRPKKMYKHRLLGLLDEFPSLGKLEIFQESLAFLGAYGLKFYMICQDINQLKSRETGYGLNEAITSNCHIQNAFPPNRIETAEHLSKLTGQTTVVKEQITTSGRRLNALLNQMSRTTQEVQRPLLTPDECLRMPGPIKDSEGLIKEAGDMVIYVAGFPAIYGKQPLFFQDPVFSARAAIPAPKVSDKLRVVAELREEEQIRLEEAS
ncbi:MAG: type IV secretory system conjugative DNA transfer family protein [Alphaproteobacteria bacterium]|nr:type IV secretory system conjugative DNA transfer family protein [Alphaproteobacteria bacterium]